MTGRPKPLSRWSSNRRFTMSAVKTVAWSVLTWAALRAAVRAASISAAGGSWVYYYGGSGGYPVFASSLNRNGSSSFYSPKFATPTLNAPAGNPAASAPVPPPPTPAQPVATVSRPSVSAPDFVSASARQPSGPRPADAFLNFTGSNFSEASQLA